MSDKKTSSPVEAQGQECAMCKKCNGSGIELMGPNIDVQAIMAAAEAGKASRAEQMPTERDAIRVMFDAWQRLKELGWRDGHYMPTTGERFAGIQSGSTGIHAMTAEKTDRQWAHTTYTTYDGDIWPSRVPPVLFRPWRDDDVQPNLRPTYLGMVDVEK